MDLLFGDSEVPGNEDVGVVDLEDRNGSASITAGERTGVKLFVGLLLLVVLVCEHRVDVPFVEWLLLPYCLLQELENVGSVLFSVYEVPMLEQFVHVHALLEVEAQIAQQQLLVIFIFIHSAPHELHHTQLDTFDSQLKQPFHGYDHVVFLGAVAAQTPVVELVRKVACEMQVESARLA